MGTFETNDMTDQQRKDLAFLKEMRELTQSLLKYRYDVTKLELLDEMISDWMLELSKKN